MLGDLYNKIVGNKRYYVHLRCNDEKTGDYIDSSSRLVAAEHFANKKRIDLKDWLKIYKLSK